MPPNAQRAWRGGIRDGLTLRAADRRQIYTRRLMLADVHPEVAASRETASAIPICPRFLRAGGQQTSIHNTSGQFHQLADKVEAAEAPGMYVGVKINAGPGALLDWDVGAGSTAPRGNKSFRAS